MSRNERTVRREFVQFGVPLDGRCPESTCADACEYFWEFRSFEILTGKFCTKFLVDYLECCLILHLGCKQTKLSAKVSIALNLFLSIFGKPL